MPTMTASMTDAQWARLIAALCVSTTTEADEWLVAFLANLVKQHEKSAAENAVAEPASW